MTYRCEYCLGTRDDLTGIHFPSDFDDREDSRDGKVFVARCDACWLNGGAGASYESDTAAAAKIAAVTGWEVKVSLDSVDAVDPTAREEAKGKTWGRPYFEVTLKQALDLMERR